MHVVTELFKKKKRVHSHFLSHRHRHARIVSSRYILYFNAEKMPEKDNFILNTLSYVSDLKITSTDGRPEKEGKGILEILSLSEETYMLYC